MGILKGLAKVAGTVVLGTIGVGTGLLNSALEAAGRDTSPTLLADIQDGSFNTIKKMWHPEEYEKDAVSGTVEEANLHRRIDTKGRAMLQAMEMAEKAKKAGNIELYNTFNDRRESLQQEIIQMEEELRSLGYY